MLTIATLLAGGFGITMLGARFDEDKLFYSGVIIMLGGFFAAIMAIASPDCASGALTGASYIRACG